MPHTVLDQLFESVTLLEVMERQIAQLSVAEIARSPFNAWPYSITLDREKPESFTPRGFS